MTQNSTHPWFETKSLGAATVRKGFVFSRPRFLVSWIVGGLRGCTNRFGNVHAQQRLFLLCFGASPTRSASPRAEGAGVLLLVTPWAALSAITSVVSFPIPVEQSF